MAAVPTNLIVIIVICTVTVVLAFNILVIFSLSLSLLLSLRAYMRNYCDNYAFMHIFTPNDVGVFLAKMCKFESFLHFARLCTH